MFSISFLCRINWEEKIPNAMDSSEMSDEISQTRSTFLMVYTLILVFGTLAYMGRSFSFSNMCLRISVNMHDSLFRSIIRAKMHFFNEIPSGCILNRFARDISNIDTLLPAVFLDIIDVCHILT